MVDTLLTVAVLLSVVAAMSTLTYAIVVPNTGETYTGFSVLTEDASGDLVAAGYPTEFVQGESQQVVLSIANHEGTAMTYEVVVELHRVDGESGTVLERMEIDRFSTSVADRETWHEPVAISPQMVGEDLRLVFYLYVDEAPADPSTETATEYLHLWIDVTADP